MQIKSILCWVITASMFLACSSSSNIYLKDTYKKRSLSDDFVVVPFKKEWTIDATISNLNNSESEYLYSSLTPSFAKKTPNRVEVIDYDGNLISENFTTQTLRNKKESIQVNLPPQELLDAFEERYAYFFESYGFKVVELQVGGSSYAGHEESATAFNLYFETEFYLLDKQSMEIVSWGKISDKTKLIDSKPRYDDYEKLLKKISSRILKEGPFLTK